MADSKNVAAEREHLDGWWFVHWYEGNIYCLRLKAGGPNIGGTPTQLEIAKHPWLLRARLEDAVSNVFDRYPAHRRRPFSFLAQKQELVGTAAKRARVTHPLLTGFRIIPRYTLN